MCPERCRKRLQAMTREQHDPGRLRKIPRGERTVAAREKWVLRLGQGGPGPLLAPRVCRAWGDSDEQGTVPALMSLLASWKGSPSSHSDRASMERGRNSAFRWVPRAGKRSASLTRAQGRGRACQGERHLHRPRGQAGVFQEPQSAGLGRGGA